MPVPIAQGPVPELFPRLSRAAIDACRTLAWYDTFEDITIPTVVIDLEDIGERDAFMEWLESPSIFMPEDSRRISTGPSERLQTIDPQPEPRRARSDSVASSSSSSSSSSSVAPVYRLPKTNEAIRSALSRFGGSAFPKLNWTAPQDAAFILPPTGYGPLHCDSPADIYLLLKSSDLIWHDLDTERAYMDGQEAADAAETETSGPPAPPPRVELSLKRFENIQPSREFRCFVRNDILIGVSQRDMNFYDHLQPEDVREGICNTVRAFWEDEIRGDFSGGRDYVFDLYLSSDLGSCTILDFNPYRPSTDPLLFSYPDLHDILLTAVAPPPPRSDATSEDPRASPPARPRLPILRVIDSKVHPGINRAAPRYGSNMMPVEMVEMSQGRSLQEFREAWEDAVARGMTE